MVNIHITFLDYYGFQIENEDGDYLDSPLPHTEESERLYNLGFDLIELDEHTVYEGMYSNNLGYAVAQYYSDSKDTFTIETKIKFDQKLIFEQFGPIDWDQVKLGQF